MSTEQNDDLEGFGGDYSDRKYETFKLAKGGGEDTKTLRPVAHPKFGTKKVGMYWKTHFGWKGVDDKDPDKTVFRPFTCLEERDNGRVVQECPVCNLRKAREDKIKAIEIKGKELKKSRAEIEKHCAPHRKWLKDHGLDGKVRIPCYDKKGKIGIFLCPYGMYKAFQEACRKLQQKGVDPAGPKGVFFDFIRSKQASFDSDSVEVSRITVDDSGTEKLDFSPLTKEMAKALLENIPNLDDLRRKDLYTLEQIQQLADMTAAADGSYDPIEVDRILGIEHNYSSKSEPAAEEDEPQDPSGVADTSVEDDEFAAEPPAPKAAPVSSKKPVEAPAAEPADAGQDDDLDSVFGP